MAGNARHAPDPCCRYQTEAITRCARAFDNPFTARRLGCQNALGQFRPIPYRINDIAQILGKLDAKLQGLRFEVFSSKFELRRALAKAIEEHAFD